MIQGSDQSFALGIIPRYCESETHLYQILTNLKNISCPHCFKRGNLVQHGYLYGYGYEEGRLTWLWGMKRGKRIYCSNRKNKTGCGRTIGIIYSAFVKRLSLSCRGLWKLLTGLCIGIPICKCLEGLGGLFCASFPYSLVRRFKSAQSSIRINLARLGLPPPPTKAISPIVQTIEHLKASFPNTCEPVSAYQERFQQSFI